jgi:pectin methylesterase-like acyl-CoA thioesterase
MLTMALLGSLTVVSDFGFKKSLHSDALATYIQQTSTAPILVAITHRTHSEIRELVALAYSFERLALPPAATPQFMLVSDNQYGRDQFASVVKRLVANQPQPLNLIGVNLDLEDDILPQLGCNQDETKNLADSGYRDRFYLCN